METAIIAVTTTWDEVILVAVTVWMLQYVGTQDIYVRYDDGTPAAGETGMRLKPGQSLSALTGLGDVWVRTQHSVNSPGSVAVTQA